ncbi:MmgE/PrpD family protein [Oricola thermophila]|uniref:MmgE/PrpD family protein n=1 Tax=Oricola thermophila TaxID=2742145 RepID=A0A6N1VDH2_9HYPH|nr:MmgE/PrpD family protein [Oricola thermophila]QKV18573.1 MmgE/PrpD family protein [Oricola thermophila]
MPWLVDRVLSTRFDDFSERTIEKGKTFLLDTLGVGVAGCNGYRIERIIKVASSWGSGDDATVWVSGERLPATAAAFVNAYQIHSLEFDCLSEEAVLHPFATILSSLMAYCERSARRGAPVHGRDFLAALIMGIDVSVFLGKSATGPTQFFRPATAGGMGAAAALARIAGFDSDTAIRTLGNQYGQSSGTLQPHVEGSPLLGMQVGFNARAAIASCDFAAEGILGPADVLTGRYGFFKLYEGVGVDIAHGLRELEEAFQIERMSHKPFPSGRLTHGVIDGLMRLQREAGFSADDVEDVTCDAPGLVNRLVGRPDVPEPTPNYAKLCLPFVAATYLVHGKVDVEEFLGDRLTDPRTHALAARITLRQDGNPSNSAMAPQTIRVRLKSGAEHAVTVDSVYGHYNNPLTREENLDKFRRCWGRAAGLSAEVGESVIAAVDRIETLDDIAALVPLLVASRGGAGG